ncbi:hypothetical protein CHS0354_006428 [Potamilus streckersoni]|uniref:Homeobox domain-containing protein n=1 Tax=Potamilus streckersoni TaxID=2493646 RepID=A0AAE0T9V3_9BIVA|nr:hypothetical protein CHS0354_006428 [Potamilus streckersoni]
MKMGKLKEIYTICGNGSDDCSPNLSGRSQTSKKKRKTRTAFSNQQIYELEKRFHNQKYITPVDRDEISMALGLTSAQVITWFQNRRAKFKRDIEEMKNDVTATTSTQYKGPHDDKSSANKG